jgi:hypothetical protein
LTKRCERIAWKGTGHGEEKFWAEQIVTLLCQIEISMVQGQSALVACPWQAEGRSVDYARG